MKSESVDLVIYNAKIHLMDGKGTIVQAMAIRDGKIIEYGPDRQILNKYSYAESVDAQNRDVYPGLIDAHGHLFSYAKQKLSVGLVGSRSFEEVIQRIHKYQNKEKRKVVVGIGWDQSLWGSSELPDNSLLNIEFPNTPVCIYRIDGHSALVNQAFIDLIGPFNPSVKGGEVLFTEGKPNGMFIDAALSIIEPFLPKYNENKIRKEMLGIQQELFQYGVTGVHEAGIDFKELELLIGMVNKNTLKLNIYAMLNPSEKNRDFASKNGVYRNKNLSVRSFKAYVDGALGSRGALLKQPYTDMPEYNGLCLMNSDELKELGAFCLDHGYQLNSHGIGDSAISIILDMCKDIFVENPDHRFRIEHAQIVDPEDFHKFSDYAVFSSVQPTHATTDQRWVKSKIGDQRLKGAYAYKTLKESTGMIALGTDFPVEYINPFYTIHAAVHRKNHKGEPKEGFLYNEALTMEETLQGMTIWAAYSAFEEKFSGSIEVGKNATFFILDKPLNLSSEFKENFSWMTFIDGELVYSIK